MNRIPENQSRILAIAPSTRGFGFAILEGRETLIDWGVKSVKGEKNAKCVIKAEELISHYQPSAVILHDHLSQDCRRAPRIRELIAQLADLASWRHIETALLSRKQVRRAFFAHGEGTKHALAEMLAQRFPQELGFRLPTKRRLWMSEDYRMDIFDALALALAFQLRKARGSAPTLERQNSGG